MRTCSDQFWVGKILYFLKFDVWNLSWFSFEFQIRFDGWFIIRF